MKFNDIDLSNWHESDVWTDDLWLIQSREKSGKHENVYHGNFVPQVAYQLISRYTKKGETVLDPFCGSGTSLFECEKLGRKFIGLDINEQILNYVKAKMSSSPQDFFALNLCDNASTSAKICIQNSLDFLGQKQVAFAVFHPPYHDIVKFTQNPADLSNCKSIDEFLIGFRKSCENSLNFLAKDRYFAVVIGDIYKNSEVIPLSFLCLDMIKRNFKTRLKGVIVKNIEGNRGKLGAGGIWRYRALKNDYYIFKHEYILIFKKEF